MTSDDAALAAHIFDLLDRRAEAATICPSEVARAADPDGWRALMPEVQRVAATLVAEGRFENTSEAAPSRSPDSREARSACAGPLSRALHRG